MPPSRSTLAAFAALTLTMASAAAHAGHVTISGVSTGGNLVSGLLQFDPADMQTVLDESTGAGGLHQVLKGHDLLNDPMDQPPLMGSGWSVAEQGAQPLVEWQNDSPPNSFIDLAVDRYKDSDGSSRLRLVFDSYSGSGHQVFHSKLTLNYDCACGDLYDAAFTSALLTGRNVQSGIAFNENDYTDVWNPSGSTHTERTLAFTQAVPEPSLLALAFSGVAAMFAVKRRARRA